MTPNCDPNEQFKTGVGLHNNLFVFSIMGPKKEAKLSRFVPLDDIARLPALLSSLTLLGGDSIQELDEGSNDNPDRSREVLASKSSFSSMQFNCRRKPLHQ